MSCAPPKPEGHCHNRDCKGCATTDYLAMAGLPVQDTEATGKDYAVRVGVPQKSLFYPTVIIMSHRIPWWQRSPGDCGQPGKVSLGAAFQSGKYIGTGTSVAAGTASIAGFVAGGATTGTAAGIAGGAALATGIGAVAALAILPFAIIGAHHAQAVAFETKGGCEVALAWNGYAEALENGLKDGSIALNDALASLDTAYQQINSLITPIAKTSGDAGALMRFGVRGTIALYKDGRLAKYVTQKQAVAKTVKSGGIAAAAIAGALIVGKLILAR